MISDEFEIIIVDCVLLELIAEKVSASVPNSDVHKIGKMEKDQVCHIFLK